jgi:hypothetical protein
VTSELKALVEIFQISSKRQLEKHCRSLTIWRSDLYALIMAAQSGDAEISHYPIYIQYHPPELTLTEENLRALHDNGVGAFKKPAQKTVNKLGEMMRQRRIFAAHLFWFPDYPGNWHLFHFDQSDTNPHTNHWQHGSHIHLINMLTHPRTDPVQLISELEAMQKPHVSHAIHIRYKRGAARQRTTIG